MIKNAVLIGLIVLITACSREHPEQRIEIKSSPIERPRLILPEISTYRGRPVTWVVITPDNVNEKFAELSTKNQETVFFAMTSTGYQNISLNITDLMKLVQEQRAIIVAYRKYYETNR